jgi:hypothetical protein
MDKGIKIYDATINIFDRYMQTNYNLDYIKSNLGRNY